MSEPGFPLVSSWPDEPAWHTCRFNASYLSEVVGAVLDYAYAPLWEGTTAQQAEMVAKIHALVEQISTAYECPEGSQMDVIQIGYALPSSQNPPSKTATTWHQVPYNQTELDTTESIDLDETGTVVIPSGTWLLTVSHFPRGPSGYYMQMRVTDSSGTIYTGAIEAANTTVITAHFVITSDGETPLEIEFYSSGAGYIFGWSYDTSLARSYGAAKFTKIA